MAGKRVISTEAEATGSCYQLTLPQLMWSFRRSIIGGINNIVFHGLPYGGDVSYSLPYAELTSRSTRTPHGPASPPLRTPSQRCMVLGSPVGISTLILSTTSHDSSTFSSRVCPSWTWRSIKRSHRIVPCIGVMDQPIWKKQVSLVEAGGADRFSGYTYGYLDPDDLALPNAQVSDGILAPSAQAYKALVVRGTDALTTEGANRIAALAQAGLPVVFFNGTPSYFASYDPAGAAQANQTIQSIMGLANVHQASTDLAAALQQINVQPRTRVNSELTWYTAWRHDNSTSTDYVFVFNDSPSGSSINDTSRIPGIVEFEAVGVPYFMDAWSGNEASILNYTQTDKTTSIFLELATNQGIVVAFKNPQTAPTHAIAAPPQVVAFDNDNGTLRAHVASCAGTCVSGEIQTSDGKSHNISSSPAASFTLGNWSLTVEHWDPPSPLSQPAAEAVKHNTTHAIGDLVSWQTIDELKNVSGRGYYTTTFDWPPTNGDATGATISLGPIYHTIRASVNGDQLPGLDTTWAEADISQYLHNGLNTIDVAVSTTLGNVLNPIWNDLLTGGRAPIGAFNVPLPPPAITDYGLLHPAVITPYVSVDLT